MSLAVLAPWADPSFTVAVVPGGTLGQPTTILVNVYDNYGEPWTDPTELVEGVVSGANSAILSFTWSGGNQWRASYTPATL